MRILVVALIVVVESVSRSCSVVFSGIKQNLNSSVREIGCEAYSARIPYTGQLGESYLHVGAIVSLNLKP
jgi:hypothetical protein